ncbi:hypothetical protein EVAR_9993_1 [Eumeta japonica]|uniref:Uncharacterized protein n=1 Tax=Eumeta variegata TaxID=151549 RepID=A0A4C1TQZ4_EUMVA|nr:hypothetical protein EVAR_9993_1 [Eumeta japonica]
MNPNVTKVTNYRALTNSMMLLVQSRGRRLDRRAAKCFVKRMKHNDVLRSANQSETPKKHGVVALLVLQPGCSRPTLLAEGT